MLDNNLRVIAASGKLTDVIIKPIDKIGVLENATEYRVIFSIEHALPK